jgi:NADPH-dependent 2,4-dienoyl-CoA reductase/sulfur reductase-like enzyme
VLVGGGLIGIELAEMLHWRGLKLTLLEREPRYWGIVLPAAEADLVARRIRARDIELRLQTQLAEILDDGTGRVGAVRTDAGDRIDCELVGLAAGVSPNLDLVRDSPLRCGRGILVDQSLRTNQPNVFAAGDCAEIVDDEGKSWVQQVWYTGRMQGEAAAASIAGQSQAYDPGIWFNSAKFFDLEFQTYGRVPADATSDDSLYWQDDHGQRAVRIAHRDGRVVGFNFLGLRARHRECERWIREGATVERVLDELPRAHFDAEFQSSAAQLRRALSASWKEAVAK